MYKIVILTGAGISAESGIKTFRDSNGLWEGHRVEDVATPEAFYRNPSLVYDFYNLRRAQLLDPDLKPNEAHFALADFEKKFPNNLHIITQNVDNLHERAGSKNVIHMHGELQKIRCLKTGKCYPWTEDLNDKTLHPEGVESKLRPHIVWFGEVPLELEVIESLLTDCDIFMAIGTSGVVYPAAGFVNWTKSSCQKIEFNVSRTEISSIFDQSITGPASLTVPEWFNKLLRVN